MRRRFHLLASRRWRIALGILAIALPAMADAPKSPPQYQPFSGEAVEISDIFTGLVWNRRGVRKLSEAGGQSYCNQTVFQGSGRVPTVKELLTLVDEAPHPQFAPTMTPPYVPKAVDQGAFPDASTPTDNPYWTSTSDPTGKYWTVDFATGKTELRTATELLNVRCVR